MESGYRSDGKFATGMFWIVILRLAEVVFSTGVAVMGGGLLAVAFTYLIVRCVGTVAYTLLLRRLSPWIRLGTRHASLKAMKQMAKPAFGFIALPLGNALSIQGLMLVIGARLGPIAVVAFSTLRTLSRVSYQLIGVIKNAFWPELSKAFGEGNISLARRLHRRACQASLGLSVGAGAMLWLLGPLIYRMWIRHSVSFDANTFHLLLLVAVTNSFWDTSSVIPMSTNSHCRISLYYSILSAFMLALAWVFISSFGLPGAALALLVSDVCMSGYVLNTTLRQVQDSFREFAYSLAAMPALPGLRPAPEV
jgi:O-antigen/teichoic acid export membrane protein